MQIQVEKLRNILNLLRLAVPRKPTLAILSNVLVMNGHIVATDLENWVTVELPESQGESFLMNYRQVTEALKFVPGYDMLTIEPDEKTIKLSWEDGGAAYPVPKRADYPPLPTIEAKYEAQVNGDRLVEALKYALPYCATETNRPVLSGVAVYLGDPITVAGADGFRMSYQAMDEFYPVEETEIIIVPPNTVNVLDALWRRVPCPVHAGDSLVAQLTAPRKVNMAITQDGKMEIRWGNVQLISALIQGTPPDHLSLLGGFKEPKKVHFMAPDLYTVVRRLAPLANSGKGGIRLQWDDQFLTAAASSAEEGESSAKLLVYPETTPSRIAIDIRYLEEYLSGKEGMVTMGMDSESGPALFHFGNTPVVVVMPMQVAWPGDPVPEPSADEQLPENPEEEGGDSEATEDTEPEEPTGEEETHDTPATEPVDTQETPEPEQPEKPKRRSRRKKS
jgi:DNA polymerase III sliding clamp (beta) subunit (PCNA family)